MQTKKKWEIYQIRCKLCGHTSFCRKHRGLFLPPLFPVKSRTHGCSQQFGLCLCWGAAQVCVRARARIHCVTVCVTTPVQRVWAACARHPQLSIGEFRFFLTNLTDLFLAELLILWSRWEQLVWVVRTGKFYLKTTQHAFSRK